MRMQPSQVTDPIDARILLVVPERRSAFRVCGDTSALGPDAPNWAKITAHIEGEIAGLSACAARLLDQSLGRTALVKLHAIRRGFGRLFDF